VFSKPILCINIACNIIAWSKKVVRLHTEKFKVIQEYDTKKNYDESITPRLCSILTLLQKDQIVTRNDFRDIIFKNFDKFTTTYAEYLATIAVQIGQRVGIFIKYDGHSMTVDEFLELPTVSEYIEGLKKTKKKHLPDNSKLVTSTKANHFYKLRMFNTWLSGKIFELPIRVDLGNNTYRIETKKVKIKHVEHFFKLYKNAGDEKFEYAKVCKKYLNDKEYHGNVSTHYMIVKRVVITEYFKANGQIIQIPFKPDVNYNDEKENDERILTIPEIFEMLTKGDASLLDRAVLLTKFQRGLDNITLADRFNFEAWPQIIDWFKTEDFTKWDLNLCPVPVILTRIKIGYKHRGFLDVDAVTAIIEYLRYRQRKKGYTMKAGEPIFVTQKSNPISESWITDLVIRLADHANIQAKMVVNGKPMNIKTAHELRDTLKSTLIECGTVQYVAELAIGHMIGDSYEKQDKLYPETSRQEYAKASKKINIISNANKYIQSMGNITKQDKKIEEMEERLERMEQMDNEKKRRIDKAGLLEKIEELTRQVEELDED